MSWRLFPQRRTDPAKVLRRGALLLCGFALTWMCAAFGLFLLAGPDTRKLPRSSSTARAQVRELERSVLLFQIEHGRCPKSNDDLIASGYADASNLVDPWCTPIPVRCTQDDVAATSAGPDRIFGTADDVTNR
jgi:hypothetical protein